MKLRLRGNSLRLRLSQSEVEKLVVTGLIEESVDLTPNPLVYMLHSAKDSTKLQVSFLNGWITVSVPEQEVAAWAASDSVGMESTCKGVSVLIEKDFACAHGDPADNADMFPNPTTN